MSARSTWGSWAVPRANDSSWRVGTGSDGAADVALADEDFVGDGSSGVDDDEGGGVGVAGVRAQSSGDAVGSQRVGRAIGDLDRKRIAATEKMDRYAGERTAQRVSQRLV